jgi:hypothetical protein
MMPRVQAIVALLSVVAPSSDADCHVRDNVLQANRLIFQSNPEVQASRPESPIQFSHVSSLRLPQAWSKLMRWLARRNDPKQCNVVQSAWVADCKRYGGFSQ